MPDTPEQLALKERFRQTLIAGLVEAASEADARLQPARLGCGWGESTIGVYRRETRNGRDVLGEVPDHPIDSSVGVIRVDERVAAVSRLAPVDADRALAGRSRAGRAAVRASVLSKLTSRDRPMRKNRALGSWSSRSFKVMRRMWVALATCRIE